MTIERKLTIGIPTGIPAPKPLEAAFGVAQHQVFPFLKLTFIETNKKQGYDATIEVSPSIYQMLVKQLAGNEAGIFMDLNAAIPIGTFSGEMMDCFRLLGKYGLMSSFDTWLTAARERLMEAMKDQRRAVEQPANIEQALSMTAQILKAAGILQEVEENGSISALARDILQSGKKDFDTVIYRMAMAVYWAGRFSGQPLFPTYEDPVKMYLAVTSDKDIRTKFDDIVIAMESREDSDREEFVRTLIAFTIGAYVSYKSMLEATKK